MTPERLKKISVNAVHATGKIIHDGISQDVDVSVGVKKSCDGNSTFAMQIGDMRIEIPNLKVKESANEI